MDIMPARGSIPIKELLRLCEDDKHDFRGACHL
jgi:hypothetical protein